VAAGGEAKLGEIGLRARWGSGTLRRLVEIGLKAKLKG